MGCRQRCHHHPNAHRRKNARGDHADNIEGYDFCCGLAEINSRHIGQHHAKGRADGHQSNILKPCRQKRGCDLGFVAHLHKEEGDDGGHENAAVGFGPGILIFFVRD
jgi:hypothetical protein